MNGTLKIINISNTKLHTWFTYSKWNMDEIFGLKVSFSIIVNPTIFFFEIHPCAKKIIFITKFVFLDLNSDFYEVNELV